MYDSGANVSIINYDTVVKLKLNKKISGVNKLNTFAGTTNTLGSINLKTKIFNISNTICFYIVKSDSFHDDILLGLDAIKEFKLCQDENLKISQKETKKGRLHENVKSGPVQINIVVNSESSLEQVLKKHKELFTEDKFEVGKVKGYEATVKLTENKYIARTPYKCSIADSEEINSQIKSLSRVGLIERSTSPFASPVTLVFKKEERRKSRFCVDYSELNKIIIPECHPFPIIDDLLIRVRDCNFFSKLDVNSAFWSIPIREKDRYKTAFITQNGHWQWKCLPFGLKSSPAIFQRILSDVLVKNNLETFAINYIDDILIFSESYSDHLRHINEVLIAIEQAGFKLNKKKCTFAKKSVIYLGHEVRENEIKPLNDNLIAIRNFPTPHDQKNVRQLLGKINFYLKYIPKASIVLEPLHNLLRKNVRFEWTQECEDSFKKIKNYLSSEPILAIFDPKLPIYIFTDASKKGVAAILKQPQKDNAIKPVFFFSKKLTKAQENKRAIFLEVLAIKECILYWQYKLIGSKFTIFTDHKPLENFNVKKSKDPELIVLLNYISNFDFDIKYNPGKNNAEADSLSRNPVLDENTSSETAIKIGNFVSMEELINDQKQLNVKEEDKIKKKENICYKILNNKEKIWVSEDLGIQMIKNIHKESHIGVKQLTLTLTPKYYFKNMHKHIKLICRACDTCVRNKSRFGNYTQPLSQLGPAAEPFQIISLDTIGGFSGNKSPKKYLHLVVDHFTKYAFIVTSKTQTGKDFINLVKKVQKKGKIKLLLADQYAGINSKEFKNFLKAENITNIFTAVDCPFSNGQNERTNQTLVNSIRCKIFENKDRPWSVIAEQCVENYNNTIHSTTKFTPNYLLNGIDKSFFPSELNENNLENLETNRRIAFSNAEKIHNQNKVYYDKHKREVTYEVGDLVYIQNGNRINRKKLDPIRVGPFKIKHKISDLLYVIDSGFKTPESNVYHASKMIPYIQTPDS